MDFRVQAWWLFMCAAGVLNAAWWLITARRFRAQVATDADYAERQWQLALSAIYVLVCAFRGALPRADVQRIVLFDTFWSSVAVGRSVATVAELACAAQWALLMAELGRDAGLPRVRVIARLIVPIILFAECCSWYAVLTTNYLGNTIEESSWTVMAVLLAIAMYALRDRVPALRRFATVGVVGAGLYVCFMITVDVRMYLTRWLADQAAGRAYLSIADGWRDVSQRWVVTGTWEEWRSEMAWMGLYFSAAVLTMVGITNAPRAAKRAA
jgi:hypothetical protein